MTKSSIVNSQELLDLLNSIYEQLEIDFELTSQKSYLKLYASQGIISAETDPTGHITILLSKKAAIAFSNNHRLFLSRLQSLILHELKHREQYKAKKITIDDSELDALEYYLDMHELEAFAAEIAHDFHFQAESFRIDSGISPRLDDAYDHYSKEKLLDSKEWSFLVESIIKEHRKYKKH